MLTGRKRLTERVDRWRRQGSGWELSTTPILQTASIRQIFDQQGQRLRRIDGDGTVGFSDILFVLGAWGPCK